MFEIDSKSIEAKKKEKKIDTKITATAFNRSTTEQCIVVGGLANNLIKKIFIVNDINIFPFFSLYT